MVVVTLKIDTGKRSHDALLEVARAILEPVRVMRGCLDCQLWCGIENPKHYFVQFAWRSRDDLTRFIKTRESRTLLVAIETLKHKPDLKFDVIDESFGIEGLQAFVEKEASEPVPGEGMVQ